MFSVQFLINMKESGVLNGVLNEVGVNALEDIQSIDDTLSQFKLIQGMLEKQCRIQMVTYESL